MFKKTSRRTSNFSFVEPLESRTFLSAAPVSVDAPGTVEHSAIVRDVAKSSNATTTKMSIRAGVLGQAVVFTVTVKGAASFGAPTGMISITDIPIPGQNSTLTATLTPGTSKNPAFAVSTATYTVPSGAGGMAAFLGYHRDTATFEPTDSLATSAGSAHYTVKKPPYKHRAFGLKVGEVTKGSGTETLQQGDTANMLYTGYLVKGGSIFDDSDDHGGTPFSFVVQATPEAVVPGFDLGALGMTVGETRALYIPSALGYGKTGSSPSIPANADLIFLITLVSIS